MRLPEKETKQFLQYCEKDDEYEDITEKEPNELDDNISNTKFGKMGYFMTLGEEIDLRSGKKDKFYSRDDPMSANIRGIKKPEGKRIMVNAPFVYAKKRRACVSRTIKKKKEKKERKEKRTIKEKFNNAFGKVKSSTQDIINNNNPFLNSSNNRRNNKRNNNKSKKTKGEIIIHEKTIVEKPKDEPQPQLSNDEKRYLELEKIKLNCKKNINDPIKSCENKCDTNEFLGFCKGDLIMKNNFIKIFGNQKCYKNNKQDKITLLGYLDSIYDKKNKSVKKYKECFYDDQCETDMKCVNIPEECNLNKNRKICL